MSQLLVGLEPSCQCHNKFRVVYFAKRGLILWHVVELFKVEESFW
jgi:hypothetical protein